MNALALAAVFAIRLVDPTGDAVGDGTLTPPTSPVYANAALFDLHEVAVTPGTTEGDPSTLEVSMGAIEVDESQPAGFNRVVTDVYLDDGEGGAVATLSGPGMLMPARRGWEYAVRISPRGAFGAEAPSDPERPVEWSPLQFSMDGSTFLVTLPWSLTENVEAYAVTGVYDAFSTDSWRALADSASPWSFAGGEQVAPVIDLIANDNESQLAALRSGMLPAVERPSTGGLSWLLLAMAGVLIAATGLWLRRMVAVPEPADELDEPATVDAEKTEPDASESDASESDASESDASEPEATEPDASEPGATEPPASEPGATEPEAAEPEAAEPEATDAFGGLEIEVSDLGYLDEETDDEPEDDLAGFVERPRRPLRVQHFDGTVSTVSNEPAASGEVEEPDAPTPANAPTPSDAPTPSNAPTPPSDTAVRSVDGISVEGTLDGSAEHTSEGDDSAHPPENGSSSVDLEETGVDPDDDEEVRRTENGRTEDVRTEGSRTESSRREGSRTEGSRTEGGQPED